MEKVYVIVPVYKVEAYLERCIDSILNQTYQNFELVLVDDGSPDNCGAICDRYAAEHENITVIHQKNGGLSAARNAGIDYAFQNGNPEQDWITFIDSDDFVHPKYLEYLYRATKESNVQISIGGISMTSNSQIDIDGVGQLAYTCYTPEEFWCRNFTNAVVAWGKLYQLCLFDNIRYPAGKLYEDNFTTHLLLFPQQTIAFAWARLYYWYENPSSITRSSWTSNQLDILDALDGQLAYFTERGFSKAYKASLHELFGSSIKQLMYIRAQSPDYRSLVSPARSRMWKAFRRYISIFGVRKAVSLWFSVRFLRPLKRVLHSESIASFLKRRIRKCFRSSIRTQ